MTPVLVGFTLFSPMSLWLMMMTSLRWLSPTLAPDPRRPTKTRRRFEKPSVPPGSRMIKPRGSESIAYASERGGPGNKNGFSASLEAVGKISRRLQAEKKRRRGWWGSLLADKPSSIVTREVEQHLSDKMCDPNMKHWDEELELRIQSIPPVDDFVDFELHEVRGELQMMRCRSAVGPDGISVSLLREIASHEILGPQLLQLINHIVRTRETPPTWRVSFLALLAKCERPSKAKDLRPICVSSAFNKLVNRLVCARALPKLRRGSRISACGRGRQAADLIGGVSRIRDVVREWKLPCILCKLDVAGAFDKVDRRKVADLLCSRLRDAHLSSELRYLLGELHTHELRGKVPGGEVICLQPNNGIKQGAPESAEIFGILIDSLLMDLVACSKWRELGTPWADLDVDLLFYQDDIFLVETELKKAAKKIRAINNCLGIAGLALATDKTKIVASPAYSGARAARVGEDVFKISPSGESLKVLGLSFSPHEAPSQQAQELLGRARGAAAAHQDIFAAQGAWMRKIDMIRCLVESQWSWTAGAVFWNSNDLHAANVMQLQIVRRAFRLRRAVSESWVDWNSRSLRLCRVWLQNNGVPRWSSKILALQHNLHGHWARHTETDPSTGNAWASLPMRTLAWRSTHWWRAQQALSSTTGMRHPGRFYASNTERQISDAQGTLWHVLAQDRIAWCGARERYVQKWDIKWTSGRQLALRY